MPRPINFTAASVSLLASGTVDPVSQPYFTSMVDDLKDRINNPNFDEVGLTALIEAGLNDAATQNFLETGAEVPAGMLSQNSSLAETIGNAVTNRIATAVCEMLILQFGASTQTGQPVFSMAMSPLDVEGAAPIPLEASSAASPRFA